MMVTAAGLIVGLLAGIATARGLRSMIYGVSPYDSATFLTTVGGIGLATILMACLAAMRATNIDIVSVLKSK
jgi:hypothetical protein